MQGKPRLLPIILSVKYSWVVLPAVLQKLLCKFSYAYKFLLTFCLVTLQLFKETLPPSPNFFRLACGFILCKRTTKSFKQIVVNSLWWYLSRPTAVCNNDCSLKYEFDCDKSWIIKYLLVQNSRIAIAWYVKGSAKKHGKEILHNLYPFSSQSISILISYTTQSNFNFQLLYLMLLI